MTILSSKIIIQRILEGLEKDNIDKIKTEISPDNLIINNQELAEKILGSSDQRRKISENFKIEPGYIRKIASYYGKIQMEEKRKKSENNRLPILFDSLDIEKVRPANYDLRLGDQYYISSEKHPKRLKEGGFLVIEPGDFAILTTHEYMYVPDDLLGLISLRYKYKKIGLINISGFHVDPGYVGKLSFSVYNAGPKSVILKHKEPVFMILFDKLEEPVLSGYGEGFENIAADEISGILMYHIPSTRLKAKIDSLETQLRIVQGIVIALLVAIIVKFLG